VIAKPIINLNPQSFIFSGISSGATPAAQNMVIKNTGDANLSWRWTRVNATGGASPVGVWCRLQNSGGTDININTGGTLAPDASVTTKAAVTAPVNAGILNDCNIQIYDSNAINNPQNASIDYVVRPTNVSDVTATLAACPSQNVTLSWTAAGSGSTAKTYKLYRNTSPSIPGTPYASGITTTVWTDSSPKTIDASYYYWVEAVSGGLTSTNKVAANGGAGLLIPNCGPVIVTAVSVTPNNGSGTGTTFAELYNDTAGAADIAAVYTFLNAGFSGLNGCYILWDKATNQVFLRNDADTTWGVGRMLGGSSPPLSNSQCTMNVETSSITTSGNDLTFNIALSFNPSFAGLKEIWMYAGNSGGQHSGWQLRGNYTVTIPGNASADIKANGSDGPITIP
ncbi:MAG: hypothetical protein AAB863_00115, partial [Patescibacteria group bacterium]